MSFIYTNRININLVILVDIVIDIKKNYRYRRTSRRTMNREYRFYIKKIINLFLNFMNDIRS